MGVFAALIGVFEIAVKTAFLDWEAAVLPLNYARKPLKLLSIPNPLTRFPLSNPCQLSPWPGSYIAILVPANALQEHDLANVGVEGWSPFARSSFFKMLAVPRKGADTLDPPANPRRCLSFVLPDRL
jgi:hypothetical protein